MSIVNAPIRDPLFADKEQKSVLKSSAWAAWLQALVNQTNNPTSITVNGHYIGYAAAAPATGAWKVGDRVYNSVPAAGQPKSWACTVAGSPGTWVSEGNL